MSDSERDTPRTIGDNWSSDSVIRLQQIRQQEQLVSEMCDIYEVYDEWELESVVFRAPRGAET